MLIRLKQKKSKNHYCTQKPISMTPKIQLSQKRS